MTPCDLTITSAELKDPGAPIDLWTLELYCSKRRYIDWVHARMTQNVVSGVLAPMVKQGDL